jgi:hypothetical protein
MVRRSRSGLVPLSRAGFLLVPRLYSPKLTNRALANAYLQPILPKFIVGR